MHQLHWFYEQGLLSLTEHKICTYEMGTKTFYFSCETKRAYMLTWNLSLYYRTLCVLGQCRFRIAKWNAVLFFSWQKNQLLSYHWVFIFICLVNVDVKFCAQKQWLERIAYGMSLVVFQTHWHNKILLNNFIWHTVWKTNYSKFFILVRGNNVCRIQRHFFNKSFAFFISWSSVNTIIWFWYMII